MAQRDIDDGKVRGVGRSPFSAGEGHQEAPFRPQTGGRGMVGREGPSPVEAFLEAQKMSYVELAGRRAEQRRVVKETTEEAVRHTTEAMRRMHIEELMLIANYDALSQGAAPDQAIIALYKALELPEYAFVEQLYPGLTDRVRERYEELMAKQLYPGFVV